ncbi:hypothetical protein THAOC_34247, partial [Thalassiosira oceanica]
MSSPAVDYDALEATTSIEEITADWKAHRSAQDILRELKNDELTALWVCGPWAQEKISDYVLGGSAGELGWLGHFMKKSKRLERFGIYDCDIFHSYSEQSIDRFLDDLGKCNHIKKMNFERMDLAKIIHKLGDAMKKIKITHLVLDSCYLGVSGATFLFMESLEELCIFCEDSDMLDDDTMANWFLSLAACKGMRKLILNDLNLSTSCATLSALAQGLSECKQMQSLDL